MRALFPGLIALLAVPVAGCPVSVGDRGAPVAIPAETPSLARSLPQAPPTGPMAPPGSLGTYTSVPVRIDVRPPDEPDPVFTQAALLSAPHVTFSGLVVCEACAGALILRVAPFQGPGDQLSSPPGPLTALTLSAAGPFRILVPTGAHPVEIELLIDADGDGHPSRGERQANVVGQGELTPDEDRSGFVLDGTEPMARPWGGGMLPSQPPPEAGS